MVRNYIISKGKAGYVTYSTYNSVTEKVMANCTLPIERVAGRPSKPWISLTLLGNAQRCAALAVQCIYQHKCVSRGAIRHVGGFWAGKQMTGNPSVPRGINWTLFFHCIIFHSAHL